MERLVSNINVRLSKRDMDKLKEKADKYQLPLSSFVRMEITKNLQSL
tara:strand:+ start:176 stop:316 length:141 start_codon:yes stop_codon:yes gene_type:complete